MSDKFEKKLNRKKKKSVLRFHEFFREIARADKIFIVTFVTSDE